MLCCIHYVTFSMRLKIVVLWVLCQSINMEYVNKSINIYYNQSNALNTWCCLSWFLFLFSIYRWTLFIFQRLDMLLFIRYDILFRRLYAYKNNRKTTTKLNIYFLNGSYTSRAHRLHISTSIEMSVWMKEKQIREEIFIRTYSRT